VLPPNMRVVPVPVLDDNYAYLCELLISSSCLTPPRAGQC